MLKKLLKYEFRSLFKLWWIFAVIITGIFTLSAFVINTSIENPDSVAANIFSAIIMIILIFSSMAFVYSPIIISSIRFYKNLFSDEGYLTFTLPVKRSHIINSKIISSMVIFTLSIIVLLSSAFIAIFIIDFDLQNLLNRLKEFLSEAFSLNSVIWSLEGIVLFFLCTFFSIATIFASITFASVITKKARVITAIGIYYGVNTIVSFIIQLSNLLVIPWITNIFTKLPESMINPFISLSILCVIIFVAIFDVLLYTLIYYWIDKKLNLA